MLFLDVQDVAIQVVFGPLVTFSWLRYLTASAHKHTLYFSLKWALSLSLSLSLFQSSLHLSLFLYFCLCIQMFDINKFLPMTGFEPRTSGIRSDRSTN